MIPPPPGTRPESVPRQTLSRRLHPLQRPGLGCRHLSPPSLQHPAPGSILPVHCFSTPVIFFLKEVFFMYNFIYHSDHITPAQNPTVTSPWTPSLVSRALNDLASSARLSHHMSFHSPPWSPSLFLEHKFVQASVSFILPGVSDWNV